MFKTTKISYRRLAEKFRRDKDTIKNWIQEVENWTESEKEIVKNAVLTKEQPDIDFYKRIENERVPFHNVEYGMTDEGEMFTYHMKKKHIAPDKDENE